MKLQVPFPFPMIYLPRYMTMEPEAKLGFYGEFEVIKKTRGIITQVLKFRNVITDVGLKYLAGNSSSRLDCVAKHCQLGTGSTTPTSSDTALQTYGTHKTASSATGSLGSTNDRYYKRQFEFGLSDAIGSWTELGMSWTYGSGSNVFCRMLFKDDLGDPTSIIKTADDTMTVIYYLHVVRSSDVPTENTVTVDSTDYTVQSLITNLCLQKIASSSYWLNNVSTYGGYARLGTGTTALSPTQTACYTPIATVPTLYSVIDYVADSFYREFMFEFPASITGNIAEFCFPFLYTADFAHIAMRFPTPIPKTDDTKKIRLQPRVTYARAEAA
jgi:hypothetical protein